MNLSKDTQELLDAGVINIETADKIREYYKERNNQSGNRMLIVFGVLGAILTGLGVILILAHNWDELGRMTKTIFAFLPLLIGQGFCLFALLKKADSTAWKESTSAFLIFAIGASISLISQIYNIPGGSGTFLLSWVLLSLPLVYIMKSSISSILYIIGITNYACEMGYWSYPPKESLLFWLLLALVLPHYYYLYRDRPRSNFINFHHWLIPAAITIVLGTVIKDHAIFMLISYISLFGLFYSIGTFAYFNKQSLRNNGYVIIASLGTISILLGLSFNAFWEELISKKFILSEILSSPEMLSAIVLTLAALFLFARHQKGSKLSEMNPIAPVFLLFILSFIIGMYSTSAVILINIILLGIGILTIKKGARIDHLGILNYGLLIITALIICRFFDTNISFIFRGILFILVGVAFFMANFRMVKKRKLNDS